MVRLLAIASLVALALAGATVAPAAAAPDNKNTETFDVSCDEPLGDITVSSNGNGDVVFTEDGHVLVAKHISGTSDATLSVEGGPTIPLEQDEPFEEGAQGEGFEDRLLSCDFTIEFEDTFKLNKRAVAFLELGDEFVGATATVHVTVEGTAEVIVPGK